MKKILHTNETDEETKVVILIVDKINFNTMAIKKDKGHCRMIKGSIQEQDIVLVAVYAPSIWVPKYTKQTLT